MPPEGVYIADTSAWTRADHPTVRQDMLTAIEAGRILTCWPVRFELLFSAPDAEAFAETERMLANLGDIRITVSVQNAALTALRELARKAPGHHRVPLPDLLVAAAAQEAGVGVLHYDRHFDRLAEVLSFESRWLAPPGSL